MIQTLVICVDGTTEPIKVMPPNLEGKNHLPQLKIMCGIPRLMWLQLPSGYFGSLKVKKVKPKSRQVIYVKQKLNNYIVLNK